MGVKRVTVSFDVPIAHFLSLVEHGHSEMKISLYGEDKPPKRLNGHGPKLLPPPRGGRQTTLRRLLLNKIGSGAGELATLRAAVIESGYSSKSVSNAIFLMKQAKLIAAAGHGHYRLTPKGVESYKLGADHG